MFHLALAMGCGVNIYKIVSAAVDLKRYAAKIVIGLEISETDCT
ncbi:hypothetical protein EYZ11_010595 [Aspergillus tanneri]|uniref:Uncharacterized protein n=1 Tax=Aspergillus tanneri TaxID=1220188 RepID=A0A4S3J4X8_9EURO|nr:hypothetical protein EYZ11_010595 [Aspergillus tanneri]